MTPSRPAVSLLVALVIGLALTLGPSNTYAKPRPPVPPLPERGVLRQWRFDEGAFLAPALGSPLEAVGAGFVESWSAYALRLGGLSPALVRFPIVDAGGRTNLNCQTGSVRFWFKPDWSSQSAGGKGPGGWARLIEVGAFTEDARFGWWSLHVSPEGDTMHFRAQAGGQTAEFLRAKIAWQQGEWHEVVLAYDGQGSLLYLDGQPAAQGTGVTLLPSAKAQDSLGFAVGSDMAGDNLAQGEFEELTTYRQPVGASEVAWIYGSQSRRAALGPVSAEEEQLQLLSYQALLSGETMLLSSPPPPPGGGGGGGGTNPPPTGTNAYATPGLKLTVPEVQGSNVALKVFEGTNGVLYDLFRTTNLIGSSITNATWNWLGQAANEQTLQLTGEPWPDAFYLLGTPQDSDGDGLTDAFERLVSKSNPLSSDTDGDGLPDGWEVSHGMNPNLNESALTAGRLNYQYDGAGRVRAISGVWGEALTLDGEGNVQQLP